MWYGFNIRLGWVCLLDLVWLGIVWLGIGWLCMARYAIVGYGLASIVMAFYGED